MQAGLMTQTVGLAMAEISSSMPQSGGMYYAVAVMGLYYLVMLLLPRAELGSWRSAPEMGPVLVVPCWMVELGRPSSSPAFRKLW